MAACLTEATAMATEDQLKDEEVLLVFKEKFSSTKKVFMIPAVYFTQQKPKKKKGKAKNDSLGCHMPEENVKANKCDDREKGEKAERVVIDLCRSVLHQRLETEDSACFILHNCRSHPMEIDIIIVHRYLGLVLIEVKQCKTPKTLNKAKEQLTKAKDFLRDKLEGWQPQDLPITMAAAFPSSDTGSEECEGILLLLGKERNTYVEFFEKISINIPQRWRQEVSFKRAVIRLAAYTFRLESYEKCALKSYRDYDIWWLNKDQIKIVEAEKDFLHIHGPHGVGKSILLIHKAREWLKRELTVLLLVGHKNYDPLLIKLGHEINFPTPRKDRVILARVGCDDIESKIRLAPGQVAIIADEYAGDGYDKIEQFITQNIVVAMWSAFVTDLPAGIEVERVQLTKCIRCPPHVVDILNKLDPDNQIECDTEIPRHEALDVQPTLIFHEPADSSHPSDFSECDTCRQKVKEAFKKLKLPLTQDSTDPGMFTTEQETEENDLQWKHVVILVTDWIDKPEDVEKLQNFFLDLGAPVVWERQMETERASEVLLPDREDEGRGSKESRGQKCTGNRTNVPTEENQGKRRHPDTPSTPDTLLPSKKPRRKDSAVEAFDRSFTSTFPESRQIPEGGGQAESEDSKPKLQHQQKWRERMLHGKDQDGNSAVHFVRGLDFQGLEKCVVVVVHHNWRDLEPLEQTEDKIKKRRENDCKNWYRAISRCQCELIIFSATPSPLCSTLKLQATNPSTA